ncbi:TPA: hypothetical protein ACS7XF_000814 [Providencia alcalifaciens]
MIDKLYGLKVRNLDGSAFIFNDKTAPATNIWTRFLNNHSDKYTPDGGWLTSKWTCPIKIPTGYGFQTVGGLTAEVTFTQSGDRRYVSGTRDIASTYEKDGMVTITGLRSPISGVRNYDYVKILSYPKKETQANSGEFGLRIGGSSIFTNEIPDMGYAYAMKAKVYVDREFKPESVFPNFSIQNAIYFFYTDDSKSYINVEPIVTSQSEVLGHKFMSRDKSNRNSTAYTSAWYWVIAFTNMSSEQLDTPGFGLKIRNYDGKVTFNSGFGVMTRPEAIPFNTIPVNSGVNIDGITRPMYTPAKAGETFRSNGGDAQFCSLCVGNADAFTIGLFEQNSWGTRGYHGNYTIARTAMPAIILDAADYFPFP